MSKPKVCLAATAGGHLTEIRALEYFYKKYPHFFVSDKRGDALDLSRQEKVYFVSRTHRNPLRLLWAFLQSFKIFFKEKPDVIITTGADTAFPISVIAKIMGKKLVYIESFARITEPSLSAKLLHPLADLFFVQWPENKRFFSKAIYAGSVL
jgi:UDP-N-acetylglucosamine:LPS N-acetylglucosamine transferase